MMCPDGDVDEEYPRVAYFRLVEMPARKKASRSRAQPGSSLPVR